MSEPLTEAGKRLCDYLNQIARAPYSGVSFPTIEDDIAAIEQEAAARAKDTGASEGLRAALEAVESRHRQVTRTEGGEVGNSVDGRSCSGCREDWPCSATRLRLAAASPVPESRAPRDESPAEPERTDLRAVLVDAVLAPGFSADRPSGPRTEKGHTLASSLRRRLPRVDIDYDEWVRDIEAEAFALLASAAASPSSD